MTQQADAYNRGYEDGVKYCLSTVLDEGMHPGEVLARARQQYIDGLNEIEAVEESNPAFYKQQQSYLAGYRNGAEDVLAQMIGGGYKPEHVVEFEGRRVLLVNFTPHDVVLLNKEREVVLKIAPSGRVAKLKERDVVSGSLGGLPLVRKVYEGVIVLRREDFLNKSSQPPQFGMPAPIPRVFIIVPMLVGQQLAGTRPDLIGPDFGIGGVRSKDGSLSGALQFIQY